MLAAIKRFVKILLVAAVAAGFLAFSVDNRQAITVSFFPLPYSAELPEFLFAIICIILGALTGGFITSLGSWHIKRQHKKAKARVAALENEVKARQEEKLPAISK